MTQNASASATTIRFSYDTVQYRAPDGNLTWNARTLISRSRDGHHETITCTSTTGTEIRSSTGYV